jgi:hypothetical protein
VTRKRNDIVNPTFGDLLKISHRFRLYPTPLDKAKSSADGEAVRLSYVCRLPSVDERSLLAGMAHLKKYLESKVVDLISESAPLFISETPPQWSASEISQSPNASIFLVVLQPSGIKDLRSGK